MLRSRPTARHRAAVLGLRRGQAQLQCETSCHVTTVRLRGEFQKKQSHFKTGSKTMEVLDPLNLGIPDREICEQISLQT